MKYSSFWDFNPSTFNIFISYTSEEVNNYINR